MSGVVLGTPKNLITLEVTVPVSAAPPVLMKPTGQSARIGDTRAASPTALAVAITRVHGKPWRFSYAIATATPVAGGTTLTSERWHWNTLHTAPDWVSQLARDLVDDANRLRLALTTEQTP